MGLPTQHEERHVFAGLEALPARAASAFEGMLLARHRELDARTGTWLSPDPLGLEGGLHRQRYAEGDPLGFVDPLGLTATPVLRDFGHAASSFSSVRDGLTSRPASGGGPDACTFSATLCGGQQAGRGRRFVLNGDDPPDAEVDAGKSARRERHDAGRGESLLNRLAGRPGLLGRVARRLGGDATTWTQRVDERSIEVMRSGKMTVRPGFFERLGDRLQASGGRRGWWHRSFPEGSVGAQVGSAWRRACVWLQARDATQLNYAADAVESAPFLLRGTDYAALAGPTGWALRRSGLVDAMREHAAEEYRLALEQDPEAAAAGADSGLALAVLIDVAIPGPGGEAKAAGEVLQHADDLGEAALRAADEVLEGGVRKVEEVGSTPKAGGLFTNKFPADAVGSPLQSFTAQQARQSSFSRRLNYVVTENGELRLGRINNSRVGGGHIDLAGGAPVRAAGEVHVVDGQIRMIDNSSGHYLPSGAQAQSAAEAAFQQAGLEITGTYVEKVWSGTAWVPK